MSVPEFPPGPLTRVHVFVSGSVVAGKVIEIVGELVVKAKVPE
jgi:hypothetical protein